jgi:3-oxoadipate enol-lactonase
MPSMRVRDINLYYELSGKGNPLLLIHGLGSSTREWEPQVLEFSKAYQVIAIDLRGHGKSDKPQGPYTIPQFASDTAELLKALGVGSAHVVGLSLGGGVGFQLAIDFPDLVRTLVIVNSGPVGFRDTPEDRLALEQRIQIVQRDGMRAMGQVLSQRLFPKPEQASLRGMFVERWAENDPRAYMEATRSLDGWDVTDKLGSIRIPTLVISADQDYTPVAVKEAYAKLMPDARLVVIPDAHHATPLERPNEFNSTLMEFLSKQIRSS